VIITRSPLRISLGGGGTDLPSYYREHGGFLIAAAIDQHVYIVLHEPFVEQVIVKYSELEKVSVAEDLKHPIVREALRLVGIETRIEIASMSDIPAGTGLGSSGSFTTALLLALHLFKKTPIEPRKLAEQACHIEIDLLREPIGKQDQYIAAFGGISCFTFQTDDQVDVEPLRLSSETLRNLEDNLLIFFTGYTRSASGILKDQDARCRERDPEILANLHFVKQLGYETKKALERGDLACFAELMHVQWERKKARSGDASNSGIDEIYQLARARGALSGKLLGAGGGGFMLFYTEEKTRLRRALTEAGLREVRCRFDFQGTRGVAQS
jgi:D-glycero-alpha-D-manno-heptose-7-phosphate kinase